MTRSPGPDHRLSDAEAVAVYAGAPRPVIVETVAAALALAREEGGAEAEGPAARHALILAAAGLHLLLWGPLPVPPGDAAT